LDIAAWPFGKLLNKLNLRSHPSTWLRMRSRIFNGLDLMARLSNHEPHLFQQPAGP
jgi:hypothetical protein